MEISYSQIEQPSSSLNSYTQIEPASPPKSTSCIKSPCRITLFVVGFLILGGSSAATWALYPHVGNIAYGCLGGGALVAIPLMILSVRSRNQVEGVTFKIGSPTARVDENRLQKELENAWIVKVKNLVIYGNNLKINRDPGIARLNPQKLILDGARIIRDGCVGTRLDDVLGEREDWLRSSSRVYSNVEEYTRVEQIPVTLVEEGLKHVTDRRSLFSCERYHAVYVVKKQ